MDVYPCVVIKDRFNGSYSKAAWTAWNCEPDEIPVGAFHGDMTAMAFWFDYKGVVGKGDTPAKAIKDLVKQVGRT